MSRVFLGILRFDEALLKRLADSNAARHLLASEYVKCPDRMYRPAKQLRSATYREISAAIRRYRPDIDITIMMEPAYVLENARG